MYLGLEITLGLEWNYFHLGITVPKENCECGEIVMRFSLFQGLRRSYKTPWLPRNLYCFAPFGPHLFSQPVIFNFLSHENRPRWCLVALHSCYVFRVKISVQRDRTGKRKWRNICSVSLYLPFILCQINNCLICFQFV